MKYTILNILLIISIISCRDDKDEEPDSGINFKQEMREFVVKISEYSKSFDPTFIIVPQNGIELITQDGNENDPINHEYLKAIDGHGQEDLVFGYNDDNQKTPTSERLYLQNFLNKSRNEGKIILVTDYCHTAIKVDDSYTQNQLNGYVSFAAEDRELNMIPNYPDPIFSENKNIIHGLSDVENFLYLINPENYNSKSSFVSAIISTNYDLLIMDHFFHDGMEFTASEISQLRNKSNGGKRLVLAYMSIGEAEDYRYYWQSEWGPNKTIWLDSENPHWEGNYKVKYWKNEWQDIIVGNDDSYLKKILDAGFDGVYLDIIDAFEYFE